MPTEKPRYTVIVDDELLKRLMTFVLKIVILVALPQH